jgi:hypothetical protein
MIGLIKKLFALFVLLIFGIFPFSQKLSRANPA